MKNLEQHLNNLKHSVSLSAEEKEEHKRRVLAFAAQSEPQESNPSLPHVVPTSWFSVHPGMRYALLAIALFLISGSGVTLAATGARPGTLLYPIKVEINEEIIEALQGGTEKETVYNVERLDRRFEEAEDLAEVGSVEEETLLEVSVYIAEHAEEILAGIDTIAETGDIETADSLTAFFETVLVEHRDKLELLEENLSGQPATTPSATETITEEELNNAATSTTTSAVED